VLAAGERIHGISMDVEQGLGETGRQMQFGAGVSMPGILFEDPLFEQALMNEPMLALISYLLGESCQLSSMGGIVKAQGDAHLELHADLVGNPSPYPPYAQVANATWVLTDYDRDNGSTCFVDGSHLLCRPPSPAEAVDLSLFTPIEAPAGSVIIWGSNVWHGAVPRLAAGLRVSLIVFFARWYLYKSETDIAARVTPDMLARNPARFRRLTGIDPVALIAEEEDAPTMGRAALSRFA
jgi:ectoine hydroxylase-related dioxygenase (phytanoyl-CoA dioxygenase family)